MGKDLYKSSGVDIDKGDSLVEWLKSSPETPPTKTKVGAIEAGIGGFAGVFTPNFSGMAEPQLVAGSDGVGTKLLLAIEHEKLEGVGIDLVAMCANDLYCIGARPMFFCDYYATGKLDEQQFRHVLSGIQRGLRMADCALLGGETAELPGLYAEGHLDLAGFIVGVVDRQKQLSAENVKAGDRLVAIPSSGFHSNGYSLIRSWLKLHPGSDELLNKILEPTAIYGWLPDALSTLNEQTPAVRVLANITGGGLSGNLVRVLPPETQATIDLGALPTPRWMAEFIEANGTECKDVEDVFNLGVGMVAVVAEDQVERVSEYFSQHVSGPVVDIGSVSASNGSKSGVVFHGG